MYDMKQFAIMLKGAADMELEVTRLLAVSGLTTETLITRFMAGWELMPPKIGPLTSSQRSVLRLRYISGLKWESICDIMYYGQSQIHNINRDALKVLQGSQLKTR